MHAGQRSAGRRSFCGGFDKISRILYDLGDEYDAKQLLAAAVQFEKGAVGFHSPFKHIGKALKPANTTQWLQKCLPNKKTDHDRWVYVVAGVIRHKLFF